MDRSWSIPSLPPLETYISAVERDANPMQHELDQLPSQRFQTFQQQMTASMFCNYPIFHQPIHALPNEMSISDVNPCFPHEQLEQEPVISQSVPSVILMAYAIPFESNYSYYQPYHAYQNLAELRLQQDFLIANFSPWKEEPASSSTPSLEEIINSFASRDLLADGNNEQAPNAVSHQTGIGLDQSIDLNLQAATSPPSDFFCNFCVKSRRHRRSSHSHNLRDVNGRLTCPILLNYKCPICKSSGHTAKYCNKTR